MALEELQVTEEFLKQNQMYSKIKPVKKGGPYSKNDRDKRMNEVYRLHFEYGYSARKISELMKVNRNTVNSDINYWYSKVCKNVNFVDPEDQIIVMLQRLEIQVTRLREQLDKAKNYSERISIERLIYEINSKIIFIRQKLAYSHVRYYNMAIRWFNEMLEKQKNPKRHGSVFETYSLSSKANEKIKKIIKEDRKNVKV